jgi:uncharacterized protein (DUF1330 family)
MPTDDPSPAYFFARLSVTDVDTYRREYGRKVLSQLAAVGAKLLVASPSPTVLEGDWDATWTALIQFPSREVALRWYHSQDYAPLKRLRVEELTTGGAVVLFDAYKPPTAES